MADNTVTIEQLPSTVSLDGTELVPIAVPNGAGGYTTQQTTTGSIASVGVDAEYVLVSSNPLLPDARILAGASGQVTVNDGGAAENVTIGLAASGVAPGTYGDTTHVAQVTIDSTGRVTSAQNVSVSAGGTVTSVALTAPPQFDVSGTPVTGAGTLGLTWANQSGNQVFAGPASGGAGTPAFRALVGTDLPASGVTAGTYGDGTHVAQVAVDATGRITAASAVAITHVGDVTSVGLSLPSDFTVSGSPVTSSGTLTGAWTTTPTGTGAMVRAVSPALTGTPTAPTASLGDNTTQIATTAFVLANAGQSLNFATYALAEAYSPASAPPYIQLAGYFSAGDGGGALYTKVASEPSHAGKLSITLSDGVTVVWYEIAEQVLTERMFGVVCDGNWDGTGTDNAVALQNWASCPVGLKKLFTGCSFSSTGTSFLPGVWLEGGGQTTGIDMTGVASMPGNFAVINCDQSSYLTAISGLSADITNPTQVPLTSAAGISPGDYICIYNPTDFSWSGYRSTYRAGEWFKVGFVSGNTLTPTEVLWHTYAAADVDLYKLTGPQVILRNFRVKPPYIVARGIFVDCSIAPIIENIVGTGSRYCNIELQRCLEEYVNCRLFELEDTVTVGDEYGIIHSACTRGQIFGEYHSQRHGIANGNSDFVCCVPNREIVVYASTFGYDGAPSLDFGHGCNEGLQAVGGSHSGIVLGGSSPKLVNLRLRKGDGQGTGASGVTEIMNGSEFWGGEFQFVGCEFDLYSNPTSAGFGAFAFTLEADLVAPIIFRMNDCKFGNYGGAVYWFQVSVSGNTQLASVIVTNPRIDDPNATLVQFVRLAYGSGPGVFDLVRVTGVNGLGNVPRCATTSASITANKWQFDPQMGTASVAGSTSVAAVTQTVTYPWAYPTGCTPLLTTTHGSRLLGGSQWYPYPNGNTNASASLGAATNSGSNFGSTATGNINWKVETA